jgi:hypothetical protein
MSGPLRRILKVNGDANLSGSLALRFELFRLRKVVNCETETADTG